MRHRSLLPTDRSASKQSRRRQWPWMALAVLALLLVLGWNYQRRELEAAVVRHDPETILEDRRLRKPALAIGQEVFSKHCASCHGAKARGSPSLGAPDLTDGDHLYGQGRVAELEDIVRYGIRSADKRGWDLASMPAYASPKPYAREPIAPLTPSMIEELTQFLLAFSERETDEAAAKRGGILFRDKGGCWDCHGADATGDTAIGAPNLTDSIWLYGDGSHDSIFRSIAGGRAGFSPAFAHHLTALELRSVAVYVASLAPIVRSEFKGESR
jgi:cytochrome c oxidase cbb3-type subunit 3